MISALDLKFGRVPGEKSTHIETSAVTVFVGPNNSGKSKVLREIDQYCREGQNETAVILDRLTFSGLGPNKTQEAVKHLIQSPNPGESVPNGHVIVGSRLGRDTITTKRLNNIIQNPMSDRHAFCSYFLTHYTLILNGKNRIDLVKQQSAGDLKKSPNTSFQALFQNDQKREEVRRVLFEAFALYFVIDPTNLGKLQIRLSSRKPVDVREERGIDANAVDFHTNAIPIEATSDGVKAFTGIISEVIAGDPKVLLIDEPEAFLHPSLASKLGQEVSRAAVAAGKRVFASTHSPEFLMGCIKSGAPVSIIRLTYNSGIATARVLPSQEILVLMRNPLLRSTGVLKGLFHEHVVVTEADSDRAFYEEVNERLLRSSDNQGIPHCLFLNAHGKHTVHTILRPLRNLGIPSAGVVDVDVLKEGGQIWRNLLESANVPELTLKSMATSRSVIKRAMDATQKDMKREGGVCILPQADQEATFNLLEQLHEYGLFVVPGGELESWLKSLGASGHGPGWLIDMFERMGDDPDSPNYVRPSDEDVWEFVRSIRVWLVDPKRKGIPN